MFFFKRCCIQKKVIILKMHRYEPYALLTRPWQVDSGLWTSMSDSIAFYWRHRILCRWLAYAERVLAFLSYPMWSIYKRAADPLILGTMAWKPQEVVVSMQGIRIFSPTYLVLLDVYWAFLRTEYRKKKINFCEILESFLVGVMMFIVMPLKNNVSISFLMPFLITAEF